jgi:uncharacterized damage-inducible protein DinB
MSNALDESLLEALLDSWDRNNTILANLLRAVPEGGLAVRAMEGSPSVAELFTHIHYVRLVFVLEDAPEFARKMPEEEWAAEHDRHRIAQMLNEAPRRYGTRYRAGWRQAGTRTFTMTTRSCCYST